MSVNTKIEWTEITWNPVTGCSKISAGCTNCYAERMAKRLKAMGQRNYKNGFNVTVHKHVLNAPLKWKKPRMVFVNSMSDLFHEDVSDEFIYEVYRVMRSTPHHHFQILSKRSERMEEITNRLPVLPNVWLGVSVENKDNIYRVEHLTKVQAKIKFLSLEPLIGPIGRLNLEGIDWVIVGGESGPRSRPMKEDWVKSIRDQCITSKVPFFFKQWGGTDKKKTGRHLVGRTWDEFPKDYTSQISFAI